MCQKCFTLVCEVALTMLRPRTRSPFSVIHIAAKQRTKRRRMIDYWRKSSEYIRRRFPEPHLLSRRKKSKICKFKSFSVILIQPIGSCSHPTSLRLSKPRGGFQKFFFDNRMDKREVQNFLRQVNKDKVKKRKIKALDAQDARQHEKSKRKGNRGPQK